MQIDIVTTATLRDSVVQRTLSSFHEKLFAGHDTRLILNVDPIGDEWLRQSDIVDIARQYFPNMITRLPAFPQYTKALKWAWGQVETEYFFYLEDDYELLDKLDLDRMALAFHAEPRLALLRLPKGNTKGDVCYWYRPNRSHVAYWNGRYYQGASLTYTGMPSMIRTSWMRPFQKALTPDINHEVRFRQLQQKGVAWTSGWKFGVYANRNCERTVRDIGEAWKKSRGVYKDVMKRSEQNGKGFVKWMKTGEVMPGIELSAE